MNEAEVSLNFEVRKRSKSKESSIDIEQNVSAVIYSTKTLTVFHI